MTTSPPSNTRPCPICSVPAVVGKDNAHRPFCSERCRNTDLMRWFNGDYKMPGEPVDPEALPPQPTED